MLGPPLPSVVRSRSTGPALLTQTRAAARPKGGGQQSPEPCPPSSPATSRPLLEGGSKVRLPDCPPSGNFHGQLPRRCFPAAKGRYGPSRQQHSSSWNASDRRWWHSMEPHAFQIKPLGNPLLSHFPVLLTSPLVHLKSHTFVRDTSGRRGAGGKLQEKPQPTTFPPWDPVSSWEWLNALDAQTPTRCLYRQHDPNACGTNPAASNSHRPYLTNIHTNSGDWAHSLTDLCCLPAFLKIPGVCTGSF